MKKVEGLVTLSPLDNGTYEINGQTFDKVILACGAWLGQTLELLGFDVDVRPPKRGNCVTISLRAWILVDYLF